MTNPVFFAPSSELAQLEAGDTFQLAGPEGHHARTVKRLTPGEPVDIVDGAGRRVSGEVADGGGEALPVKILAVLDEPVPSPSLILVQALAKGGRDELAIEAATELGIDAVVPWQAERSIVRWKDTKADKGRNKWQATVQAAAKQARRSRVPEVHPLVTGAGLVEFTALADLALVLHEEAITTLASLAADPAASPVLHAANGRSGHPPDRSGFGNVPKILLIVGPEGGISNQEIGTLSDAGATPVRLGTHVLRSSTAGPAAVSVLSHLLGRWD
ncbi:MAG TPA: 16S rRNA (uracil(1498)-N(3))-methyltransferase [Arthrobacter sp.]|nr:16S rRNA (uracil(1498)-N(3))-methyltransferase [Arthrobacter sp.]